MTFKHLLPTLLLILVSQFVSADKQTVRAFDTGSYQQLLSEKAGQGFMLVIWSLDCSTCIKDMDVLSKLHKTRPDLKIVMLSTDESSASGEIEKLMDKFQLGDLENWVFANDNSQKLRYEIDPSWYSELPRTYFFATNHQREAISGGLSLDDYKTHLAKLKI